MIREAIDLVWGKAQNAHRQSLLTLTDGSKRSYLFDDKTGKYEPLERIVVRSLAVSNLESFSRLVREELLRRDNKEGAFATVRFNGVGATFWPDDKKDLEAFTYARALSQQWTALHEAINAGPVSHESFVRRLQGLRPSIQGYANLLREFKKVTFDEQTTVTSQPILENGKAGMEFSFQVTAKGGVTPTKLPAGFVAKMPFARGSTVQWDLPVEIDAALVEVGGGRKVLKFSFLCPEHDLIEDEAVTNEIALFKHDMKTAGLGRLLILEDF